MAKAKKTGPKPRKSQSRPTQSRVAVGKASARRAAAPEALAAFAMIGPVIGTSKIVVVNDAVDNQLTKDKRWPPKDVTKVMATDYKYDQHSITNFLVGVRDYLAGNTPPYTFQYDSAFAVAAPSLKVAVLMARINGNTH